MPSHSHPLLPPEGDPQAFAYVIAAWGEIKVQLARIEGRLEGLEERAGEEREGLRQLEPLKIRQDWNDKGMTEVRAEVKLISGAYSRAMGAAMVLSILGSLLLSGFIWALTHWSEVWGFLSGGGNGPPAH